MNQVMWGTLLNFLTMLTDGYLRDLFSKISHLYYVIYCTSEVKKQVKAATLLMLIVSAIIRLRHLLL